LKTSAEKQLRAPRLNVFKPIWPNVARWLTDYQSTMSVHNINIFKCIYFLSRFLTAENAALFVALVDNSRLYPGDVYAVIYDT